MYAVIRQYSGASQLVDQLESRKDEVERVIRGVPGLVSYIMLRTNYGGIISVTVCQDKAGTDESVRLAAEGIAENITAEWSSPPMLFEGDIILQLSL